MSIKILLPKIGFAMDEGTIVEWLVVDGHEVSTGQPLYTLESDKSVQEVESPGAGVLRIIRQAGGTCKVGEVLAELLPKTEVNARN